MTDLLAAVPLEAWMAGLLAAAIGGLAAALHHTPGARPAADPDRTGDPHGWPDDPEPEPWLGDLDWDPIWDTGPRPGTGPARHTKEKEEAL